MTLPIPILSRSPSHSRPPSSSPQPSSAPGSSSKHRGTKRKLDSNTPTPAPGEPGGKEIKEEPKVARMGTKIPGSGDRGEGGEECWQWSELPLNKQGFRYTPCAPSPLTHPLCPLFRSIPTLPLTPLVKLSWLDHSPYLRLSPSALTCSTDKGFRSARANVSVREGAWYFEVQLLKAGGEGGSGPVMQDGKRVGGGAGAGGDGAHVRVGWGRREASLNGPCGLDGYSYGIRDLTGDKVHLSRPKSYGVPFGSGDVIGCYISLPPLPAPPSLADDPLNPAHIKRKRIAIRYKSQLYFESLDYPTCKEMDDLIGRDLKGAVPTAGTGGLPPPPGVNDVGNGGSPGKVKMKNSADGREGKGVKKGRKKGPGGKGAGAGDLKEGPVVRELPKLEGSEIRFFLNGKPMSSSPAFTDLFSFLPLRQPPLPSRGRRPPPAETRENFFDDTTLGYYPFLSVFGSGKLSFHPGPEFLCPVDWTAEGLQQPKSMEDRWDGWKAEEEVVDEVEEKEILEGWERERSEDEEGDEREGRGRGKMVLVPIVIGSGEGLDSAESSPMPPAEIPKPKPKNHGKGGRPSLSGSGGGGRKKKQGKLVDFLHDKERSRASATPDTPTSPSPSSWLAPTSSSTAGKKVSLGSPAPEDDHLPPPPQQGRPPKPKPARKKPSQTTVIVYPDEEEEKKEEELFSMAGLTRAQIRFIQGEAMKKSVVDRTTLSETPEVGTPVPEPAARADRGRDGDAQMDMDMAGVSRGQLRLLKEQMGGDKAATKTTPSPTQEVRRRAEVAVEVPFAGQTRWARGVDEDGDVKMEEEEKGEVEWEGDEEDAEGEEE